MIRPLALTRQPLSHQVWHTASQIQRAASLGCPWNNLPRHRNPDTPGNLALSMMMVHKAIPDTLPFLFPEVAEDMVDFQDRALVDEMERVKEHVR